MLSITLARASLIALAHTHPFYLLIAYVPDGISGQNKVFPRQIADGVTVAVSSSHRPARDQHLVETTRTLLCVFD